MRYASGAVYEGEWRHDQRCGQGTMHWPAQQQTYVGEWCENQPHGQGECTWAYRPKGLLAHRFPTVNIYRGMVMKRRS